MNDKQIIQFNSSSVDESLEKLLKCSEKEVRELDREIKNLRFGENLIAALRIYKRRFLIP
jgi:hypothetical protein